MTTLTQRTRLALLGLYVSALVVASRLALGTWFPPTSERGLWFYSGLAALILGNLLVTPFFTKPADAISYAVAALIALATVDIWGTTAFAGFDRFLWVVALVFVLSILLASILSIALKDAATDIRRRLGRSFFLFAETYGGPRAVFSIVFLFALVSIHRNTAREYLVIGIAWALIVAFTPLESATRFGQRLMSLWRTRSRGRHVGEVEIHHNPGVVLVRQTSSDVPVFGDPLLVRSGDGEPGLGVALDYIGFAEGRWLRALDLDAGSEHRDRLASAAAGYGPATCILLDPDDELVGEAVADSRIWKRRRQLLGLVAPDTSTSVLRIDIARTDQDLEEGRLVETSIGEAPVLFQLIRGLTREEIIHQKNTRGYVRADAKKIGAWDAGVGRFRSVKWVPQPNTPVFLVTPSEAAPVREAVGHFPGTTYPVILGLNDLVTHNAAILGILGAGKTYLAIELVERMVTEGIKVICLDLTNQYASQLGEHYDERREQRRISVLQRAGPEGKDNVSKNVEEGGSIADFRVLVRKLLARFLHPENPDRLVIYNPAAFEVWRQDSKPYQDKASMATLTPTEITRLFTEQALDVLQEQGMTDTARCCLVYEEAHSLIPEWNAVASEGDKAATNGTAKAILQGRKFGLGCLVITQRTANVTKTILNQCNTVFALRVFDATGMEFLRNYIGEDYAGVLSTLDDRHAVVFGRASSCSDPVLVRLNDREDFLRVFRTGGSPERT